MRFFATVAETTDVKLRGTHLPCRSADMPVMIWLGDILEPASNFTKFFNRADNKVRDLRNVWLLDYRN